MPTLIVGGAPNNSASFEVYQPLSFMIRSDQQSKGIKWFKALLLTLLGSSSIEIFLIFYGAVFVDKSLSSLVPWTFHTLWEFSALCGVAWIVKQLKVQVGVFFLALLAGMLVSAVFWMFIPDSWNMLEANYFGVESRRTLETRVEGRYDENIVYNFPLIWGHYTRKIVQRWLVISGKSRGSMNMLI